MKRRWDVIRNILEHIEKEDLYDTLKDDLYSTEVSVTEDEYVGHIEILNKAGIIKNCHVDRDINGKIILFSVNGAFITMQGHDLLDALRDKAVWNLIKQKATSAGVSLSWEFIKAAIPLVIKELLQR